MKQFFRSHKEQTRCARTGSGCTRTYRKENVNGQLVKALLRLVWIKKLIGKNKLKLIVLETSECFETEESRGEGGGVRGPGPGVGLGVGPQGIPQRLTEVV